VVTDFVDVTARLIPGTGSYSVIYQAGEVRGKPMVKHIKLNSEPRLSGARWRGRARRSPNREELYRRTRVESKVSMSLAASELRDLYRGRCPKCSVTATLDEIVVIAVAD